MIMLKDLVKENLMTPEEADAARDHYLKSKCKESAPDAPNRGRVA